METTNYIVGPHGGVWHPDAWAILPAILKGIQKDPSQREAFSKWLNELHVDTIQPDDISIKLDILQAGVDAGLREQWEIDSLPVRTRADQARDFWIKLLGDIDGVIFSKQVVDGYGISTCRHCGLDYFREFIQNLDGMPMIYWINNVPDDWGKQGPGHFQYDSICGGLCWTCGIDGPPYGPARPEEI